MAKNNTKPVEQVNTEQAIEEVKTLTETENVVLNCYNEAATVPVFDLIKSETTGEVTRNYIEVPVEIKNEKGDKVTVYRKCRNPLAVASLSTIGMLGEFRKKSLKMLVLGMAKITDEHAQSTDKHLKTAKALIKAMYPEYSDNTIGKYRRIGLLFSEDVTDAANYRYISFIDEDTTISNLDVVLTLFDKFDVEKATQAERQKAVSDFYAEYIVTNRLHLHKSQADLKKEVHDILNSVDGESKDLDDKNEQGTPEQGTPEQGTPEQGTPEQAKTDSTAETAQHSIATLTLIFKGNKTAEDALAILMEELSKLF